MAIDFAKYGVADDSTPASGVPAVEQQAPANPSILNFDNSEPAMEEGLSDNGQMIQDNGFVGFEPPVLPVEQPAVEQAPAVAPGQPPVQQPAAFTQQQVLELYQRERETYLPLVEFIRSNPDVAQMLSQRIQGVPPGPPPAPPLVAPVRPANFNPADLVNPESESAKFLVAQTDYMTKKAQELEEKIQAANQHSQEMARRVQLEREYAQQMGQVMNYVQKKHGFTPEEAQQFIQTYSDPASVSLDNLAALFRLQTQGVRQAVPPRPIRPAVPPAGGSTLYPAASQNESMQFNAGLRATRKG